MRLCFVLTVCLLLLSTFCFAQQMNIHTKNGVDAYSIADIDSITFEIAYSIPEEGLIAYYPFNGNSDEESNNNRNATNEGAVLTEDKAGNPESAYYFDGSARMSVNPTGMPQTSSQPFSVSAWLKPDSLINSGIWMCAVYWGNNPEANGIVQLAYQHTSENQYKLDFGFYANDLILQEDGDLSNQWFHLAATYDGLNRNLYLNGSVVASDTTSKLNISSLNEFYLGFREHYYTGVLDEIRIYDRALKPEEVNALFISY